MHCCLLGVSCRRRFRLVHAPRRRRIVGCSFAAALKGERSSTNLRRSSTPRPHLLVASCLDSGSCCFPQCCCCCGTSSQSKALKMMPLCCIDSCLRSLLRLLLRLRTTLSYHRESCWYASVTRESQLSSSSWMSFVCDCSKLESTYCTDHRRCHRCIDFYCLLLRLKA